jgi:hypothetical protein
MLQKLSTKEYVLTDNSGTDTSIAGTGRSFGGYPDSAGTTGAIDSDSKRGLRMSDVFNYVKSYRNNKGRRRNSPQITAFRFRP